MRRQSGGRELDLRVVACQWLIFTAIAISGVVALQTQGEDSASSVAPEDLVVRLSRSRAGIEEDASITALARQGDAAVVELERHLVKGRLDFGGRHRAVRVLKAINSEQSRRLLRRMALGELSGDNSGLERWAADALIVCDRIEPWKLLSSADSFVLVSALIALEGEPVDALQVPLLNECLKNRDSLVSWRAAAVLGSEPTGKIADEALAAIGQALAAVAELPDADVFDHTGDRYGTSQTLGERYYRRYLNALASVRTNHRALHELARQQTGRARDAVLLALAQRGDESVHDEIVRLAQDPAAGMFRTWAADALREIGTEDDLPTLRRLTHTDPLEREGLLGEPNPRHARGPTYPVRDAAAAAMAVIERRVKSKAAGNNTRSPEQIAFFERSAPNDPASGRREPAGWCKRL
jgi:HEAT repeat protein